MKMAVLLLILLAVLVFGCSQTPTEPAQPEEMSTDSLLGVIDTLRIQRFDLVVQLGRNRCLVRCMQDTLDSLNITLRCECGI